MTDRHDNSAPETAPLTLGYMTSLYARASDFFIRGEVAQLREFGHKVHTFSVRKSDPNEGVSDDVRREQADTVCLVEAGPLALAGAWLRRAFRSPKTMWRTMALARRLSTPGVKGRLWPWAYLLEASYLADQLEAKGVQHLHNHIAENSASVAMLASALSGVPFSMTVHGPNEFDAPRSYAYGVKIARSAFTVAISEYGRSQLFRWSDYEDWPKVKVVRSGIGRTFLGHEPTPVPPARRLVCVGRLAEQKGQLLLVEAAGRLVAEGFDDFEVVLIGDGPMRGPVENLAARLGVTRQVRVTGWMGGKAVRAALDDSRGLVLPSFAEGLPMVIMESLALGRPVIATYVGGVAELVEPGVNGWLVPAGSIEPLVTAMREMLTATPEGLTRMGLAGAARVAVQHDSAREVARLAKLFRASAAGAGVGKAPSPPARAAAHAHAAAGIPS